MITTTKKKLVESGDVADGRIELWHDPEPGHFYTAGVDFAFGLETGDFDACEILRDDGEQVAEIHGHWGETFGAVLAPLFDWFEPFIVGEPTATGLPILRGWYDEGRWLYYHRSEAKKGRTARDQLGHVPGTSDITVHWLRRDLRERDLPVPPLPVRRKKDDPPPPPPPYRTARHRLTIHSEVLHGELCKFRFSPRRTGLAIEDARDSDLVWGAPSGENDDLVRALALANAGLEWLPRFEKPKPKLKPDSMGAVFKIDLEAEDEEERERGKWRT